MSTTPPPGPVFSVRLGGAPREMADVARQAEELGFDQIWTGNDLFGGPGIANMAAMLHATSRIAVGSAVFDPVSIHPAQLAQLASGFQDLSGGRFLLGVGAGSDVFFSLGGIEAPRPLPRLREAVVAIKALTRGVSPAGLPGVRPGWAPRGVVKAPRPVPVYVGGMGPKILRMAGAHADGALPLCLPPTQVLQVMDQMRGGAVDAGRDMADLDVAACLWCSVDTDPDVARLRLAHHIAEYSGSLSVDALLAAGLDPQEFQHVQALVLEGRTDDAVEHVRRSPGMLGLGVVGGVDELVDQCAALVDAGVRHISFGPPFSATPCDALDLLGGRVVPQLRAMFPPNHPVPNPKEPVPW